MCLGRRKAVLVRGIVGDNRCATTTALRSVPVTATQRQRLVARGQRVTAQAQGPAVLREVQRNSARAELAGAMEAERLPPGTAEPRTLEVAAEEVTAVAASLVARAREEAAAEHLNVPTPQRS